RYGEVSGASLGNSERAEDYGSAVVGHGGCVDVGEEIVGTGQIKISGARHLSAVPRRIGCSPGCRVEGLQAVAVESKQTATVAATDEAERGYRAARIVDDAHEVV